MTGDQKELRLSLSKTKTYIDCPKKFKFGYIDKLPRKEFEYHIFGKFIHQVLEDFHKTYLDGSTELFHITMKNVYKNALKEYSSKMTSEAKKEAFSLVQKYLSIVSLDPNEVKKTQSVEKKFELEINGKIILNGMIDKICLEDGLLEVVDYKTTKNKKYLVNDFMQLLTYAFILWNEDKSIKKVKGTYSLIRHNFEKVSRIFDVEEIIEISKKYEEYGLKIRTDKTFIAKPTVLCSWCEYLEFCDEGKMKVAPKIVVGEIAWGKKK